VLLRWLRGAQCVSSGSGREERRFTDKELLLRNAGVKLVAGIRGDLMVVVYV